MSTPGTSRFLRASILLLAVILSVSNYATNAGFRSLLEPLNGFGETARVASSSSRRRSSSSSSFPTLSELTQNPINHDLECPPPLVPLYDRIVDPLPNDMQKIPRRIHLAWIRGYETNFSSRCVSAEMMAVPKIWMKQFPSYSFYFHADEAVDMLFEQDFPEFPQLQKMMSACVAYGSAMKIDIWRQLILYKYGGFYSDMDTAPGPNFDESHVQPNDTAFFLSDAWNRPSQWLFGLEENHPISYFTMLEIFKRLMALGDVSRVQLVFLTGPDALKHGYIQNMYCMGKKGHEPYETIFNVGTHTGCLGKVIRKLKQKGNVNSEIWFETVNHAVGTNTTTMTRKDKIYLDMKSEHWTATTRRIVKDTPRGACTHRWYMMDNNLTSLF